MPATPVNRKRRKTAQPPPTIVHDATLLRREGNIYRGILSGEGYPFRPDDPLSQRVAAEAGAFCEARMRRPLDDGETPYTDETASTDTASIGLAILGTTPIGHPIHAQTADDPTVEIDSDPRTHPTGDQALCPQ